ncbi:hypothetical protein HN937_10820, partial [Candidatus Poribacteria bacterium]|nr:hypothetical protein [Candidatus Poribacteria bacterium]
MRFQALIPWVVTLAVLASGCGGDSSDTPLDPNDPNVGDGDGAGPPAADVPHIAYVSERDGNIDIYVMVTTGGNRARLTTHPAWDTEPAWSPDGDRIAFVSNRDGNPEIYVMDSDGGNQINISNHPQDDTSPTW